MKHILSYAFACLLVLAACDSVEPDNGGGEEELITRVVLSLTPTGGGASITATAEDEDGDGTGITVETLNLTAGTTYTGQIELFNDLAADPDERDIAAEVAKEAEEHQFFYTVGGGLASGVTVSITDEDDNGLPVGLDFQIDVASGTTGPGTLQVILSHYDEEPKNGTDRSDETDVDVTFPLDVVQ